MYIAPFLAWCYHVYQRKKSHSHIQYLLILYNLLINSVNIGDGILYKFLCNRDKKRKLENYEKKVIIIEKNVLQT